MALVNETQLANLAKAILTETAPWLVPGSEAYEASWPKTKEYLKQIMTYLTVGGTGMGSGAEVDVNKAPGIVPGTFVLETYVAPGTGNNGGALAVAPGAITGTIKAAKGKIS